MYVETEEVKRGFPLRDFLIKLLLIIIFVVLLVLFLPIPKMSGVIDKIFNANVQTVKDAALSYFTTERLPKDVGSSVNLTLQEMIDLHLILPFTDKDGNLCNMEESYVSLKKFSAEYEMKINLKCGNDERYVLTKMGCYDYCEGSICEEKKCPECEKCTDCSTDDVPSEPSVPSDPTLPFKPGDTKPPIPNPKPNPTPNPKPDPKPDPEPDYGPACVLQITSGSRGDNGWYISDVRVSFKSKSASKNASITGYGIGTSLNYAGNNTFTVSSNGITTVYGYVKDSRGKTAKCSVVVKKDNERPSCKIDVLKGTRDANGIFISDVTVGFVSTVDKISGIKAVGIGTSSTPIYNGVTRYTIVKDGIYTIYGFVKDLAGNEASCSIIIEKEEKPSTSIPNCELQVTSGTLGNGSWYISNVNIGFKSRTTTNGATITDYGIGTSLNYNGNSNYLVSNDGINTIYGYVKDSNGNTNVCSIKVEKRPNNNSQPSCVLEITNGTLGENGWYISNVNVGFRSRTTTNGASITGYGIGTSLNYNGNSNYLVTSDGIHTIYGYIKDSYGNTASCSIVVKKDSSPPLCELYATSGVYNQTGAYFTSDVGISWKNKISASGISSYGIGLTFNYSMNSTYFVTTNGIHNVYGYLKSNSGLTSTCCVKVDRRAP